MRSIVNYSPWAELNRMWDLMDRINPINDMTTSISMPIDMFEQDGSLVVRASLPGIKPDDLSVSMGQGVLTITGERKNDFEQHEGSRVVHREHTYGSFVRSIRLPDTVDESKIDAQYENGVLTVTVPETPNPEKSPKQIPVRNVSTKENVTPSNEPAKPK